MRWVCDKIQEPAWRLPLTSLLPPEAELGNIQDTERRGEAHEGGCGDGDERTDSCFPANVSLNANPSADPVTESMFPCDLTAGAGLCGLEGQLREVDPVGGLSSGILGFESHLCDC